jgi:predicted Zn finger-like uncharacterized protein
MKFTCDSCGAQYMISDDKVGPNGVKVRCKKCQNVVLVRRAAEPAPAPPAKAASGAEPGLDAELGQAFDSMLGGPPAQGGAKPEDESTQMMAADDAAKILAASRNGAAGPATPATEWYVAINEVQVGPLPLSDVRRKWEVGDVGPDSLVWRPGMGDWAPLSSVAELASALSPVPQAPRPRAAAQRAAAGMPRSTEPAPAAAKEEPTWKPGGASALAALASEEIAHRAEPRPAARQAGGGARSLVDQMNLPDAGGVDPTGAIPLPIKGVDPTPSPRRSSVARGAAEVRHRRGVMRGLLAGVAVTILLVAGGAVAFWYLKPRVAPDVTRAETAAAAPSPPAAVATAPQPAPTPAPVAAAPKAAAPPAAAAAAAAPPVAEAPHPVPPPASKPAPKPAPPKVAAAEPAPRPRAERVATAAPPPEETAPPPAPKPAKKDSLLDFDSGGGGDSALDEALGGAPSGRSVYVPPRPGSDVPAALSASQINEAVVTQVESLRRCVSEQKSRDPEATGTLKMRWVIQGDGGVRDVKCLTPEFASGPFAKCITSVVKTIRFPRSATKGQEVTFPFTF